MSLKKIKSFKVRIIIYYKLSDGNSGNSVYKYGKIGHFYYYIDDSACFASLMRP